jgi:hypothetical protein
VSQNDKSELSGSFLGYKYTKYSQNITNYHHVFVFLPHLFPENGIGATRYVGLCAPLSYRSPDVATTDVIFCLS